MRLLWVKERVVSGFNTSRAVILMSRTGRIIGSDSTSHFETPQSHRNDSKPRKCISTVGLMLQNRWKPTWERWNGRSYPTRRTLQTLLLPTTICFDQWNTAWLISISAFMKKSKKGSIRGLPQKTHRFFKIVSDNCQKDGKK